MTDLDDAVQIVVRALAALVWITALVRFSRIHDQFRVRRLLIVSSLVLVLSVIALGNPLIVAGIDPSLVRWAYSATAAVVLIIGLAVVTGRYD